MRSKLIVNPTSGPWDFRRELPAVLSHLENHGWRTTKHPTERPDEATRLAREAVDQGLDAVFVVGGDGTINEVINGLAGSEVALGVLPGGTGNVWAKEMGLPTRSPRHLLPLVDSVRALVPGARRRIDLGRANGRYFLQWTGLGLDAEVTYAMEPRTRRQRRLGALAYIVAGVTTAATMAGIRTRIWIDEERIYRRSDPHRHQQLATVRGQGAHRHRRPPGRRPAGRGRVCRHRLWLVDAGGAGHHHRAARPRPAPQSPPGPHHPRRDRQADGHPRGRRTLGLYPPRLRSGAPRPDGPHSLADALRTV